MINNHIANSSSRRFTGLLPSRGGPMIHPSLLAPSLLTCWRRSAKQTIVNDRMTGYHGRTVRPPTLYSRIPMIPRESGLLAGLFYLINSLDSGPASPGGAHNPASSPLRHLLARLWSNLVRLDSLTFVRALQVISLYRGT
jgi:hypothetical protein